LLWIFELVVTPWQDIHREKKAGVKGELQMDIISPAGDFVSVRTMERRSRLMVRVEILAALDKERLVESEIAARILASGKTVRVSLSVLLRLGLVSKDSSAGFGLTNKGTEALAMVREVAASTMAMTTPGKSKAEPACNFCGRSLGREYFFTCHICGAKYCYIHMAAHSRAHRPPTQEAKYRKVVLLMQAPKTMEEAFGVDGESARQVAEMISRQRREEVAH
jgi:predicted transcriptional regulator